MARPTGAGKLYIGSEYMARPTGKLYIEIEYVHLPISSCLGQQVQANYTLVMIMARQTGTGKLYTGSGPPVGLAIFTTSV